MTAARANCLCAAVTLTASNIDTNFTVCHCASCRQWGSAPFFSLNCGTEVTVNGEANVTVYDSSAWACRGFCAICGTHLFYRLKESGEYHLPVGLFPDLEGLQMVMQYFSDQRPGYYCFANETQEMTRDEILEYFGGGGGQTV